MSDRFGHDILADSQDVEVPVLLRSEMTNQGVSGIVHGDVTASFWRQGEVPQEINLAALAAVDAAHSDGGWIEVDASNHKGIYRLDVPDAAFAAGADWVIISVTVEGAYVFHREYKLLSRSPVDVYRLLEADRYVDTSSDPWQLVYVRKGTGGPGVGTELLRQDIQSLDGQNITSESVVPGRVVAQ